MTKLAENPAMGKVLKAVANFHYGNAAGEDGIANDLLMASLTTNSKYIHQLIP